MKSFKSVPRDTCKMLSAQTKSRLPFNPINPFCKRRVCYACLLCVTVQTFNTVRRHAPLEEKPNKFQLYTYWSSAVNSHQQACSHKHRVFFMTRCWQRERGPTVVWSFHKSSREGGFLLRSLPSSSSSEEHAGCWGVTDRGSVCFLLFTCKYLYLPILLQRCHIYKPQATRKFTRKCWVQHGFQKHLLLLTNWAN